MSEAVVGKYEGRKKTYLEINGLGHDSILRCGKCLKLILMEDVKKNGQCHLCGSTKVTEVRTLTDEERNQIINEMDFPFKEEFLKEFTNDKK